MKLKALIVDDERLARLELSHLLQQGRLKDKVEVVFEAKNADEAIAYLNEHRVDVMFVDIQMPGKTGFDLLEELTTCPTVIFTTAFDQYALDAFAANALDYLLKPVDSQRLSQALDKVHQLTLKAPELEDKPKMALSDKVFIKDGDKCFFVAVEQVIAFVAIGNYCRVVLPSNEPIIRKSMQQLALRLPECSFFRASRSHIINLNKIEHVDVAASGNLEVKLQKAMTVELSRRQSQTFKEQMGF